MPNRCESSDKPSLFMTILTVMRGIFSVNTCDMTLFERFSPTMLVGNFSEIA